MVVKLTRLTHKIAVQLHLMAESCTICSSRSRSPVRKLLDTPSFIVCEDGQKGNANDMGTLLTCFKVLPQNLHAGTGGHILTSHSQNIRSRNRDSNPGRPA